ncbi:hypothetical protein [Hydrogenophaga sp. PAMC20947]|uniref:hypothetical protein n=1 Tax=Hydrogenophaga sp. PAMC20947 TaxID=2565558 RepID=UPI00109E0391|nr:hypothetical protein [Hydrogenophaga sp. PAMC20947]QCB45451.1 hypothetical protein E5678_05070 [Hydrogenophaga sp. PAMC20947]
MADTQKPTAGNKARSAALPSGSAASSALVDTAFDEAESAIIGKLGAARLAALSGAPLKRLAGEPIATLKAKLGHVLDPRALFMQRVCGKVVRTDANGVRRPVPLATVQVEDTDCSLLAYHPPGSPFSWLFPFNCRREVIATVKTDACGNFCVWVPRFDIDWVLRWRTQRVCFPVLFERPNWRELIEDLRDSLLPRPPEPVPGGPGPLPDLTLLARLSRDTRLTEALNRLEKLPGRAFGDDSAVLTRELDSPARLDLTPPLPAEFLDPAVGAKAPRIALESIANQLRIDPKAFDGFSPQRWIGPMRRCVDVHVPEWTPIIDVPDITFRVLQDVNGDGIEEQIYGETHFDVRWNASGLGEIVLEASAIARTGPGCTAEPLVPCGNQPALVLAGRMPITGAPSVFDNTTGYNLTANRPRASGVAGGSGDGPAQAPLHGLLSLFGCQRTHAQATHYRVMFEYQAPGTGSWSSAAPFVGVSWWLYRLNGAGIGEWHAPASDSNGWYPINLPAGANPWLPSEQLLLDWPTGGTYPDGQYRLTLEVGTGGASLGASPAVVVAVDNRAPEMSLAVQWRKGNSGDWLPIGGECPVVRRGLAAQMVQFRVQFAAQSRHFRDAYFHPTVCGGTAMNFLSGSGGALTARGYEHWYTGSADQGGLMTAIYELPATALQGTYGFWGRSHSRAVDPDDANPPPAAAFEHDRAHVWRDIGLSFSVFNAD